MQRISDKIKILRGTKTSSDRSDRDRHLAKPRIVLPPCPRELSPEARKEFRRTGTKLVQLGLVSEIDGGILGVYASAYARWMDAERALREDGRLLVPGQTVFFMRIR